MTRATTYRCEILAVSTKGERVAFTRYLPHMPLRKEELAPYLAAVIDCRITRVEPGVITRQATLRDWAHAHWRDEFKTLTIQQG